MWNCGTVELLGEISLPGGDEDGDGPDQVPGPSWASPCHVRP